MANIEVDKNIDFKKALRQLSFDEELQQWQGKNGPEANFVILGKFSQTV